MTKPDMMRFGSEDPAGPLRWDQLHWHGALGLDAPLQLAMQTLGDLGPIGCRYQADPSMPFAEAQANP